MALEHYVWGTGDGGQATSRMAQQAQRALGDDVTGYTNVQKRDALGAELAASVVQVFSVLSYGAKGDGSADDTDEIQAALDAVNSAGGGVVFFPNGTYLTKKLTVYDNTTLRGASRATTIKAHSGFSGSDDTLLNLNRRGTTTPNKNVILERLTIDGNHAGLGSGAPEYLILISAGERCIVRDCTFRDFYQYAVGINDNAQASLGNRVGSTDNMVIFNAIEGRLGSHSTTSIAGVAVTSQLPFDPPIPPAYSSNPPLTERNLVAFNEITGGQTGISVYNAAYNRVIGNTCVDQTARNIIVAWGSSYSSVVGNLCKLAPGSGIGLGGNHMAVVGNVVEDTITNRGATGEGFGINFYADWQHATISGNTVRNASRAGIFVGRGLRNASITGNSIANCPADGIRVEQNRIGSGWPTDRSNRFIVLSANVVDDTPTAYSVGPGTDANQRADEIELIGNMVGYGCTRALWLQDTDQVVLSANNWAGKTVSFIGTNTYRTTQSTPVQTVP